MIKVFKIDVKHEEKGWSFNITPTQYTKENFVKLKDYPKVKYEKKHFKNKRDLVPYVEKLAYKMVTKEFNVRINVFGRGDLFERSIDLVMDKNGEIKNTSNISDRHFESNSASEDTVNTTCDY